MSEQGTSGHPRKNLKMGAKDGKPFTSTNQPTNAQKKRGWDKKKLLKDLLGISTSQKLPNSKTDYRKLAADFYGIEENDVTIKMVMEFRQIELAIMKADTQAFNSVMDRAYGKPKQAVEHEGLPKANAVINVIPYGEHLPLAESENDIKEDKE